MYNDLNNFINNITDSDVVSIVFFNLNSSLVLDRREQDGEVLIKVFPIAQSPDERIKMLNKLRPGLDEVKNFIVIPWHSYLKVLTEDGVWDKLLENIFYVVNENAFFKLDDAIEELQLIEKTKIKDAITGNGYKTIWSKV
jgi:hypothetical protein|tara:strand:- start:11722 stop:12141 length:420 start_codon:yes stop_codon:yes gene_type:complete